MVAKRHVGIIEVLISEVVPGRRRRQQARGLHFRLIGGQIFGKKALQGGREVLYFAWLSRV